MLVTSPNETMFYLFANNYCENYAEQLAERYMFVEVLIPQIDNKTNFTDSCVEMVETNPNLNAWFDPISLSEKTTIPEVCEN